MHRIMCILVIAIVGLCSSEIRTQSRGNESLTIEVAVNKAIEHNPELQYLLKNIDASEAIKIQSGLSPNPEFGLEAENVFGTNEFSGFNGSEITASLSQEILLAGKISKREKVAEINISLTEWEYESKRLEVITNVRKEFINALVTQKLIEQNNELIKLSEELLTNINQRVKAGKISLAEVSRTKIIINTQQIEVNQLKFEYDSSLLELRALIYDPSLLFARLEGSFEYEFKLPTYDTLLAQMNNNPNLKRFESEYAKQNAVVDYEESKSTPDITLMVGYRRLNELSTNTLVLGASIPIPIFDRNQGSIQEALIRYDQKKIEYESVKNRYTLKLSILYNRLGTLLNTAEQLKNESIPEIEKAFNIIVQGNLVGRFAILDVLDTQRTLFKLQNQYMNVISDIQSVKAELEGIIGKEIK